MQQLVYLGHVRHIDLRALSTWCSQSLTEDSIRVLSLTNGFVIT